MIAVKVSLADGRHYVTSINGQLSDARRYFMDQWVNVGLDDDDMQRVAAVEMAHPPDCQRPDGGAIIV